MSALAVVVAASALLIAAGAGGDTPVSASQLDRLNLGVVAIDARIGDERVRSSGTIIDPRAGLVVTSAHGVWGATSLRLTTGLGVLHGRVVARAPCAGLAVIEIQPRVPGLVALPQAGGSPTTTQRLSAIGRRETGSDIGPEGLVTIPTRAEGNLAHARFDRALPLLDDAIRLDGAVVPDSTGGPLLNDAGELVGMAMATTAGGEDVGALAIPWSTVQARLDELRVDERRIFVGWRSYYRCALQLHAYARAEHPGYRPSDARINARVPATRLPGTEQLDAR